MRDPVDPIGRAELASHLTKERCRPVRLTSDMADR